MVKVAFTIVTKGDPNIQHMFLGGAGGDGRGTLINQLVSEDGRRQRWLDSLS
jgi:hypothetical protein